jgi:hypothetical protein
MERPELTQDELNEERGDLLPEREAMSLLTPDPSGAYPLPDGDLPPIYNDTDPPVGSGTGAAGDMSAVADAQGSSSGEESVTEEDRSEQISQSDSASAES